MIININNPPLHAVEISRQGENEFREIEIDVSSWLAEYPDGKISVIYCRPDGELYPVIVNAAESPIMWRPTATDTAAAGKGAIEVRIQIGDVLGKSCTIAAKVLGALGAPGGTPAAPAPDWAQQVTEDADRAEAAAEKVEAASTHMPQISASKTWLVWDAEAGEYVDTGVSAAGEIPEVDDTLTQPGRPADAAKVGEELRSLSKEIVTTSESKVAAHNSGTDTHSDIRGLIQGLTDRLNALADSDDTTLDQLSEVVAYIKSNRELIAAITTDKVSVADIIDNLTTNVSNKPLSAAQGVALKALIDAISIPDALPNPNALTFTGAVTGSYDGSEDMTVNIPSAMTDDHINSLIDTKLGVIENGDY